MRLLNRFLLETKSPSHVGHGEKRRVEPKGFTLLELLIVVAIIGTLASIAISTHSGIIQKAKIVKAIADIKNISIILDNFYQDNNVYPDTLEQVGLGALRDPWGNPYQYVNLATAPQQQWRRDRNNKPINTFYDLYSNGPDGDSQKQVNGAKSRDDIIRAWDGAFIGQGKALDELWDNEQGQGGGQGGGGGGGGDGGGGGGKKG
jgi:general secretion pathway protein G